MPNEVLPHTNPASATVMALELSTFCCQARAEQGQNTGSINDTYFYDTCHSLARMALVESKNETEEGIDME